MSAEKNVERNDSQVRKIRDSNQKRILGLMLERRELSKSQIAAETLLSVPTVTMNVSRLMELGLVEEAGVSASQGGRKPMMIRFIPDSRLAFGVDFSSNHLTSSGLIRMILVNLDAKIRAEESFEYADFSSVSQIMSHVKKVAERMLAAEEVPVERIMGIGFSLPGPVNERKLLLEQAPNLPEDLGMKALNFKRFGSLFPFPIFIENEANAAAYAELILGRVKGTRSMVFLSINRGIGAGIVVGGRVFKGKNKRAGTVGHITVESRGIRCTCGRHDCWEIYAASGALLREYRRVSGRKLKDTQQFHSLLEASDAEAAEVWEAYLDHLVIGINNLILSLDPQAIVIGGEVSGFGDRLLEPLRAKIYAQNPFYKDGDLEIVLSGLKADASIVGVALMPFHALLHQGAKVI
ncbi:MAG: ROK family transcriptional regulator [Spirochaetota bacterium]